MVPYNLYIIVPACWDEMKMWSDTISFFNSIPNMILKIPA